MIERIEARSGCESLDVSAPRRGAGVSPPFRNLVLACSAGMKRTGKEGASPNSSGGRGRVRTPRHTGQDRTPREPTSCTNWYFLRSMRKIRQLIEFDAHVQPSLAIIRDRVRWSGSRCEVPPARCTSAAHRSRKACRIPQAASSAGIERVRPGRTRHKTLPGGATTSTGPDHPNRSRMMLVAFAMTNYTCFRDRQELSMEAAPERRGTTLTHFPRAPGASRGSIASPRSTVRTEAASRAS